MSITQGFYQTNPKSYDRHVEIFVNLPCHIYSLFSSVYNQSSYSQLESTNQILAISVWFIWPLTQGFQLSSIHLISACSLEVLHQFDTRHVPVL